MATLMLLKRKSGRHSDSPDSLTAHFRETLVANFIICREDRLTTDYSASLS